MLLLRHLRYGLLLAAGTYAQSPASSGPSSVTVLTGGASEASLPTGPYVSYSTTETRTTSTISSPISTEAIVSTVTSGSSTITTTLGSTTIFSYSTIVEGNTTGSSNTSTSSQLLLQGSLIPATSTLNRTGNATATATSAVATNTQPCNNYPEFCSRNYGNITEVSAHNSPFVKTGNAAANQALSVTTQLNDGIRMVQGQMHFVNSTPHFCHTSCDVLDAGPITSYLGEVKNWVSSHPYDVVTILLGNGARTDNSYPLVDAYIPFIEQTGLVQYAYIPPKIPMGINDWPTLASMILTGKRVVFFMDYNANQTAYPYILDEFSQAWETPFDPTDRSFPCTVQRPPNLAAKDAIDRLYVTNHNLNYEINILGNSLLVPNIPLLNVTNNVVGEGSLGVSTQACLDEWAYAPKFLNVDFYNEGNGSVFEVAATMNNVTYTRKCCGLAASGASTLDVVGRSAMVGAVAVILVTWMLL